MDKKRILLPDLQALIFKLTDCVKDVATLELRDNYEASKRVRLIMIELRKRGIPAFEKKISTTREEIKNKRNTDKPNQ